jgi:hypothetical protein
MRMWQAQGVMEVSPIPEIPARYYTPPMVYPPKPVIPPPSCHVAGPAVVPNPVDSAVRDVVSGGRYKGMVRQPIGTPRVPEWEL